MSRGGSNDVLQFGGGGPGGPAAPPAPYVAPGGEALGQLAQGLDAVSQRLMDNQNRDAVADAHIAVSKLAMDSVEFQKNAQQNADVNPEGYTPDVMKHYNDGAEAVLGSITNPQARNFAKQSLASLSQSTFSAAAGWQATQQIAFRVGQGKQMTDNWSSFLTANPFEYESVSAGNRAAIEALAVTPTAKQALLEDSNSRLRTAAAYGLAEQNPAFAQKLLYKRMGLTMPGETDAATAGAPTTPTAPGNQPSSTRSAMPGGARYGDFDSAVSRMIDTYEGTKLVENDNGRGPTKFGINQTANPDLDVRNLTREGAVERYRTKYWDALDLDKQPEGVRFLAFNSAVNQGAPTAKKMLDASGGDPGVFATLALARYKQTGAVDGQAGNVPGWVSRLERVKADNATMTPTMVASAQANTMVDLPQAPSSNDIPQLEAISVTGKVPGAKFIEDMTAQELLNAKGHVDVMVRKDAADAQSELRAHLTNAAAAAERGVVSPPPDAALLTRAAQSMPGKAKEWRAMFDSQNTYANAVSSLSTMDSTAMQAQVNAMTPTDPADPLYAQKAKEADSLQKASNAIISARNKDPIGAASDQGLAKVTPLNFSDAPGMVAEYRNRQQVAITMREKYGAGEYSPFTADEAKNIAAKFHTMPPSDQLGALNAMRIGFPDSRVYQAAIATFAKDSPVIQTAANMATFDRALRGPNGESSQQVATGLLAGERILNPDKYASKENGKGASYTLPKSMDVFDQRVSAAVGEAFLSDPDGYKRAKDSVLAYYAHLSTSSGAYNEQAPDIGRIDQALDAVIGQRGKWGGFLGFGSQPIIKPWGMDADKFNEKLSASYTSAMAAAGLTGTQLDSPHSMKLIQLDATHFGMRYGDTAIRGRNGRAVVLEAGP